MKNRIIFPLFLLVFCSMMMDAQNPTDPEEQLELSRQYVKQQNPEKTYGVSGRIK